MSFMDGSDSLMNKKLLGLYFFHVATGLSSQFKAFLTSYDDNFSSEWSSERVYGRMDPIHTFQGTQRTISLAWDVPSRDFTEAQKNFTNAQAMYSMLYPAYRPVGKSSGSGIITSPPLVKMKFANLIFDASADYEVQFASVDKEGQLTTKEGKKVNPAKTAGLLGWFKDLSFAPDLEAGFFDEKPGFLIPQTIKLNCTFNVLHQHPLGWDAASDPEKGPKLRKTGENFPYNSKEGSGSKEPDKRQASAADPSRKNSPIEEAARQRIFDRARDTA
jgi:hypothetical protein